jgi:hypothetical protein
MSALSADCERAGGLASLSSFTFTVHPVCLTYEWLDGTMSLLKVSHLESVQLNGSDFLTVNGGVVKPGDRFCMQTVDQHRDHLIRFSLHGLQLGLPSLDQLCLHCAKLEQLFIRVDCSSVANVVCFLFCHEPVLMFKW